MMMLLVDSLYINYGGALQLLSYLLDKLKQKNVSFFLLADSRCEGKFDYLHNIEYLDASYTKRKAFYVNHRTEFSSVLCMGNVPPPIKLDVVAFTYFHNVNMLTLKDCRDLKQLLLFWLKRTFIKHFKDNSTEWYVQTSNTANELVHHLGVSPDIVKLFPFYSLPKYQETYKTRTDYIFVGEYSGSKGHDELLQAWTLLHQEGVDLTLHLTVSQGEHFLHELDNAISKGVRIINHGFIRSDELAKLYMCCKATVYPSHNESFGLGLVEAMELGCDVITANRPYAYAICQPSVVFNPESPESIAEAVIEYERCVSPSTVLKVRDMCDEMIERLIAI